MQGGLGGVLRPPYLVRFLQWTPLVLSWGFYLPLVPFVHRPQAPWPSLLGWQEIPHPPPNPPRPTLQAAIPWTADLRLGDAREEYYHRQVEADRLFPNTGLTFKTDVIEMSWLSIGIPPDCLFDIIQMVDFVRKLDINLEVWWIYAWRF